MFTFEQVFRPICIYHIVQQYFIKYLYQKGFRGFLSQFLFIRLFNDISDICLEFYFRLSLVFKTVFINHIVLPQILDFPGFLSQFVFRHPPSPRTKVQQVLRHNGEKYCGNIWSVWVGSIICSPAQLGGQISCC